MKSNYPRPAAVPALAIHIPLAKRTVLVYLFFLLCQMFASTLAAQTTVCINEIDSDTPGIDEAEFIELSGTPNGALDHFVLELFNGANDLSYRAYDHDGFSLDANGFFLIGNAVLLVKQGQMHGFTGVELSELTLIPHNADTIVSIHSLQVSVRFFPLLRGDVQLDNLFIDGGYVQLVRRDSSTNIDAFLKKDKNAQKDSVTKQVNLAERAYQLIKKGLNQIPDDVDIKNFGARIIDNEHTVKFILDTLNLSGHVFNGQFTVHSDAHVHHRFNSMHQRVHFTTQQMCRSNTTRLCRLGQKRSFR